MHGSLRFLLPPRLDLLNLLCDTGMDTPLERGVVTELEEDLEVDEEWRENEGCRRCMHTISPVHETSARGAWIGDLRTAKEVVEEGRGAALGEEVARELEHPGGDVDEEGGVERARLVGVGSGSEQGEDHLGRVQELRR